MVEKKEKCEADERRMAGMTLLCCCLWESGRGKKTRPEWGWQTEATCYALFIALFQGFVESMEEIEKLENYKNHFKYGLYYAGIQYT